MSIARLAWPARLTSALLLCACSSTGEKDGVRAGEERERMPLTPYNKDAKRSNVTLGAYLVELDRSIQTWNGIFLGGDPHRDARKLNLLSNDITHRTRKLFYELVEQLESGPPQNQRVAAAALGFAADAQALSPLLNALSIPDPQVRSNALLALAVLGDAATPLGGVLAEMQGGANPTIRSNAALATLEVLRAGAEGGPEVVAAARSGLLDPEPLVRTQSALILAHQLDAESIDPLTLQLHHDDVNSAAMAAGRALAYLGSRKPRIKGRCARALTASLGTVNGIVRASVLNDLRKLAGVNYAKDEGWVEWSHRLD